MLVAKSCRKIWGVIAVGASIVIVIGIVASQARAQQAEQAASAAPPRIDYNWDVRPILSDNCFRCHGPDSKGRQAGLRLDQKEAAYAQAITPGKSEESELFRRITSPDPSYRMPPSYSAPKSLPPADIKTLTEWIRQGAEYKPHWAFISPTKAPPPVSRLAGANPSPIDRFILAHLEKEGLTPSKEADKETLINRVTLTLTGLPPTLSEIDAFLADKSANAYEKVVDRLLASPQYGENMAAYWANISRYSESDGFLDDHHDRLFWPYRDWVISAFNKNMAFNQFGTWQIAGDLLPNATKEQRLATAFLRVGKRTTENGAIDEEYRVEYALERANLIGGGFLAMTTGCARCHDHKYDPIAQKDYYSLSGFFNSADEPGFHPPGHSTVQAGPTLPWTDPETDKKIDDARARIRTAEAAYNSARNAARADALAKIGAWLKRPAGEVAGDVQKSIDAATVAYYPFETSTPVANADLPVSYPALPHPQGLVTPFQREKYFRPDPSARKPTGEPVAILNGLSKEKLTASPSPIAGVPPAFLE
jgi:cytochrome c553